MKNIQRFTQEIERLSVILAEAERTGQLLVHATAGSEYDPYPIVFTPEQLVDHLKKGDWIAVTWKLEERAVIKKAILDRIVKLQERLTEL